MGQDKPLVWKSHWKQLGWAWKLGGAGLLGISSVEPTVWTRLMESQIWCMPPGSVALWGEGVAQKRTVASASTPVWEKAALQLLPWCWIIQFLPVYLWCLSVCCPWAGAQRKWVQVSLHRPFKRNSQGLQKLWRLIFLALEARAGGPGVWLGPLSPEISLPILICYTWVWDQPVQCLCPFYTSLSVVSPLIL